jgi:hypothetical protein
LFTHPNHAIETLLFLRIAKNVKGILWIPIFSIMAVFNFTYIFKYLFTNKYLLLSQYCTVHVSELWCKVMKLIILWTMEVKYINGLSHRYNKLVLIYSMKLGVSHVQHKEKATTSRTYFTYTYNLLHRYFELYFCYLDWICKVYSFSYHIYKVVESGHTIRGI